jgi:hypothetical protein
MKLTLLILAAFTASIAALHAADSITVVSPSLVQRNGVNVGNVASFVATNPQFAAEVQAGLEQWASELQASTSQAVQEAGTKQAAAEAKLKTLVDGAKEALTKKTSAERLAAASALLQKVEMSDKAKRLEAIAAEKAKLDTEAAALAQ